jgi:3-methyladenine DNA glycosylase AlkD
MNAQAILDELRPLGAASYKKVMLNHGVREPFFGVKISELQKFRKRIKKDYQLALDLYETGNYDAMYLAGLIADDERMTKQDLRGWARKAYCRALSGVTVAWVAAGSKHGWELGLEWIDSREELIACAGWATLACIVSIKEDASLDLAHLERLLHRMQKDMPEAANGVRYQMNGFLISVAVYVQPLTATALKIGEAIGPVAVDMGNTSCEVPFAPDYIRKVQERGSIGKKRNSAKC